MQQGLQGPPQGAQPGIPVQPQLQQAPNPSPEQVEAGIRHFHAIVASLMPVAKDPELGKSDLKRKIIDSATQLVGERILSPAEAVAQLRDVPEKPFDQKKWVTDHIMGAQHGANYLLDHFRAANPGDGNWQQDIAQAKPGNRDHHSHHMKALHDHYKGLPRG